MLDVRLAEKIYEILWNTQFHCLYGITAIGTITQLSF